MKSQCLRFTLLLGLAMFASQAFAKDLLVTSYLGGDYGGRVLRFTYDTNGVQTGVSTFAELPGATGLRINPLNGELLVSSNQGYINRYNVQTGQLLGGFDPISNTVVGTPFAQGLAAPSDIKVGPDNNIYIANTAGNTISVFSQAGTLLNTLGTPATGPGAPNFMAWDAQNRLYVSSYSDSAVYRYNTGNSTFEEFIGAGGQIFGATGLAFNGNKIFVASVRPFGDDTQNPSANNTNIFRYNLDGTPDGTFASFFSFPNQVPNTYPPNYQANPLDIVFRDDGTALVTFSGQGQVALVYPNGAYNPMAPYAFYQPTSQTDYIVPTQILEVTAIPEPSLMIGLGIAAIAGLCWKRRQR